MFFLLVTVITSMTAGAKEVTLEGSILRNLSFNVADGLECVYNAVDSAKTGDYDVKGNLRYVFTSADGLELHVYLNEIANLDREKASAAPDTTILPGLKEIKVLERQQPVDGGLDRIITFKNSKGVLQREYIGFYADGIIYFSAVAPSGDFSLTDKTAMSVDDSLRWGNLLLFIVGILIALIPSFIIASAWEERKSNLPKFWSRTLTSLVLSVIIGIAGSLIFGFPMLKAIFWMLVMAIAGGIMFSMGGTIIWI